MVNFGVLTAEIPWRIWGTPATFNGFHLGSVTARHSSSARQPNFAALNRGRHLYSAGRPSRWAHSNFVLYFTTFSVKRYQDTRRSWLQKCFGRFSRPTKIGRYYRSCTFSLMLAALCCNVSDIVLHSGWLILMNYLRRSHLPRLSRYIGHTFDAVTQTPHNVILI